MAYSFNRSQATEIKKDEMTSMIPKAKEIGKNILTPSFNTPLSQLTLTLIGLVVNKKIHLHKKQFEIQLAHWKTKLYSQLERKSHARACYAFFKHLIRIHENKISNQEDCFIFVKMTYQQFLNENGFVDSKLFETFYLILLHMPNTNTEINSKYHRLFLRAKVIYEQLGINKDHRDKGATHHKTPSESSSVQSTNMYDLLACL